MADTIEKRAFDSFLHQYIMARINKDILKRKSLKNPSDKATQAQKLEVSRIESTFFDAFPIGHEKPSYYVEDAVSKELELFKTELSDNLDILKIADLSKKIRTEVYKYSAIKTYVAEVVVDNSTTSQAVNGVKNDKKVTATVINSRINKVEEETTKIQELKDQATNPGDIVLLDQVKAKKEAEKAQLDQALAKQNNAEIIQGAGTHKAVDTAQSVKKVKEVVQKTVVDSGQSVDIGKAHVYEEAISEAVFLPGQSVDMEEGVITTPLGITVIDPLTTIISPNTQLFEEDITDPRLYETFMPVSYQTAVPAFIALKRDEGSPVFADIDPTLTNFGAFGSDFVSGTAAPTFENPFGPAPYMAKYNQFSILQVEETHSEKFQLIETLSDGAVLFSFGHKHEFWTIRGQVINDIYSNWLCKLRSAWENYLRLSMLVERGMYARFVIPGARLAFNGYPVALTINHSVDSETLPTFSMAIFVREWHNMASFPYTINGSVSNIAAQMLALDGVRVRGFEETPSENSQRLQDITGGFNLAA